MRRLRDALKNALENGLGVGNFNICRMLLNADDTHSLEKALEAAKSGFDAESRLKQSIGGSQFSSTDQQP